MKSKRPNKSGTTASIAPPGASGKTARWWVHGLVILGLLLANVALYHGTFDLGFLTVDDPDYVQNNPYIESFKAANLKHILTKSYAANYAPANLLSYALDVALAKGKSASAIHLSNVLWHGWVICAVYLLAFTIRADIVIAAAAALLFMLHPAHVEVVAWISSRKDLVATGFAALSMACYLRYRRNKAREGNRLLVAERNSSLPTEGANAQKERTASRPRLAAASNAQGRSNLIHTAPAVGRAASRGRLAVRWCGQDAPMAAGWYASSLLSFLLASGGKQSVLLLPAVMLVWDLLVEKRRNWQMLADKVPFGLVVIFFGWMTWQAQPSTRTPHNLFVMAGTEITNLWLLTGFGKYVLYRAAPDPAAWGQLARVAIIIAAALLWAVPLLLLRLGTERSAELQLCANPGETGTAPSRSPALRTPHRSTGPSPISYLPSPILATLCYWVLIQMAPPMVISFVVPITDRYLFLPSVGICLLLANVAGGLAQRLPKARWLCWTLLAFVGAAWSAQTWSYVKEWRDPRSVWYGAHLKTKNSQVSQFLGEIYQGAGDRMNDFVKSGAALQATNEAKFARAVLSDVARVERLQSEWRSSAPNRTNSITYRDELWQLAWDQYQESAAHRGTLSAPNLYMNRGRLLVGQGQFERAIPEFKTALAFAQTSSYDVVQQESSVHALRAIGVAYWSLRNYREAREWFLKAQAVQRKTGHAWVATLDQEVEKVTVLAGRQP